MRTSLRTVNTAILFVSAGCTAQLPDSFRLAQEQELLGLQDVNTKVDILWVVDNSSSMDVNQAKIRQGFAAFAATYMKPTWDIKMGVITTDSFLADQRFSSYWTTTINGSVGYHSNYISGRIATWVNPASNPTLVNTATGTFDNGVRIVDQYPQLGLNYAKLIAGMHDGPTTALCSELHPYFYSGDMNCRIRDDQTGNTGVSHCISPGGAETATTQCVNSVQNDSVRSGKPIISTMPPTGTAGDAAWVNQLVADFVVNVSVGSAGNGSERGLASVLQFISDNEGANSTSALFRAGSIRVVIFVSDEDDQSMNMPGNVQAGFTPQTNYTTVCNPKTVDAYTYTLSVCPDSTKLMNVTSVKSRLDDFFGNLDAVDGVAGTPNYIVAAITPLTGASISQMQAARAVEDLAVQGSTPVAVDRGDRYLDLVSQVGNGSLSLNIADADYTSLLDSIGRAIALRRGTFTLKRAPTGSEDMIVRIIHQNNSITEIPSSDYTLNGAVLTITNVSAVLGMSATDKIYINYQPKTVL